MKRNLIFLILLTVSFSLLQAQGYEQWRKQRQAEYNQFKQQKQEEYESFRKKANEEYAAFLKKKWEEMALFRGVEPPEEKPVPPTVCPEEEKKKPREDNKRPYEEVVEAEPPRPQPEPVEPVMPPTPEVPRKDTIAVNYYGTKMVCFVEQRPRGQLSGVDEIQVAEAWNALSDGQCDDLLSQCLDLRKRHSLNDWAYLLLCDKMSQSALRRTDNLQTLLTAWLLCQSGYSIRLGHSKGKLYLLYACNEVVFRENYLTIDGTNFYLYKGADCDRLSVSNIVFPNEQPLSLDVSGAPTLFCKSSQQRSLQSERYKNLKVTSQVNQNLVDFYNDCPLSSDASNPTSRWVKYANTPLSDKAKGQLYPQLQQALKGKGTVESVEELLNFVQTAFVYEYDDTVWGYDRPFYAEETLYYPYCDCEDRSILFSRLVRDLVGLKVVLLYYPGHLATAVRFEGTKPSGDYLHLSDGDYFVSDPTYIGARIGMSMPSVAGGKVSVVRLD